jgi:hypothetical protein
MGLSFTIAAGLASAVILRPESLGGQCHILLSHIRDSANLGLQPRIYMPQEQGCPVITPKHWVSTTRRATVEVFDPASTRDKQK